MNNTWLWIIIGVVVVAVIVAILINQPTAVPSGTEQVAEQTAEVNVVGELNVEVPEINEQVVDINLPEEI